MKRFFVTLGVILMTKFACCVEKHWQVNPHAFEFNMNVTATAYINDVEQQNEMLEIGVFFGEELRGSALPRLSPLVNKYIYDLTIYSDETCELSFKLYDHSTNEVSDLDCEQILTFVANGTEGNAFNPYIIAFSTPIPAVTFTGNGSWNDASNWGNSTLPTETDAVVIDGNAFISEEVTVNSLAINEGKSITIQNGGVFNVTGEFVNTDYDALIIEDGGQIIQTNEDVAATFKKNIVNPSSWNNPVSGWQFISSPMIDAATEGFESTEGDYDLYKFDGFEELQWVNYKNHDDFEETFTSGIGYIASYETQEVATFKGNLNNETEYFEFEINFDSDNEWACFSLLGNPFSYDIDWDMMVPSRMEEGFVTLNTTTGAYIYNVEGKIKVGEGFMVNAYNRRSTLDYDNAAKSRKTKSDYINIILSNSNGSDNVIVRFGESENAGFPKLENINPNIANVYVKEDDNRYGIYNLNPEVNEIPLYFDAKEMGTYTLTFDLEGNYDNLYLVDKMTGESVNLLIENEYSFTATSNDNPERFVLLKDNSQQTTDNSHFAYINNGDIVIFDIESDAQIRIFDALGRCVYNGGASNETNRISAGSFSNGVYMIQKIDDKGIKVQKLIL